MTSMPFEYGTAGARPWAKALALAGALLAAACSQPKPTGVIQPRAAGETRPNVLVLVADHLGPQIGAYGDKAAVTPNIDRLAREGVTFTNAYGASGSEDAQTAALLTGAHPSTIGVVQEWTGAPEWTVAPPPEVKSFPELLRMAGWHTFHIGSRPDPFGSPASLWVEDVRTPGASWVEGAIGQPFLGVIDLAVEPAAAAPRKKGLLETLQFWKGKGGKPQASPIDAARIAVPAYLPDTPEVRAGLKAEYDRVHRLDARVGEILARLEKAGALKDTVVIFTAKTGPARPRAERTVYDAGARVPLIVRWPDGRAKGAVRRDLVSGVDLAPSILKLAGRQPLAWVQGRDRLSPGAETARYVFTVQNRVDGAYERSFAVRDGRWLYVLNLALDTPLSAVSPSGALTEAVAKANAAGRLTPAQAQLFARERPEAELYDLQSDPEQLRNLARDPARSAEVARLAEALNLFAGAAPDYSVRSAQELADLFRPGGQTPMAMQPAGSLQGGRWVLSTITPGAAILWRAKADEPWRIYTGPISAAGPLEAKAVRYGFRESPVATLKR
jgi:arylsulfatase A-like enzyme